MSAHLNRPGEGWKQTVVGALSVLALLGASACSSTSGSATTAGAQGGITAKPVAAKSTPKPSATAKAKASPGADSSTKAIKLPKLPKGVSTAKPKDLLAPKAVKKVIRNDKRPRPTIKVKGTPEAFNKLITYGDGLKLKITKITQGKITGQGPGVFPGRPATTFHLTLINGTTRKMTIGVVVVTVTHGSPARLARAVYDPSSRDFSGVIKPGGRAKAVYGFSLPPKDLSDVTMTVDIDGAHQLAAFTGSAKKR